MWRFITAIGRSVVALLASFAIGGLVFPPQLFAASSGSRQAADLLLGNAESIQVILKELRAEDLMPQRFRVVSDSGMDISFVYRWHGYDWRDSSRGLQGRVELPDLGEISSWHVEQLTDGIVRALVPASYFAQSSHRIAAGNSLVSQTARAGTAAPVEIYGYYSEVARNFEAIAIGSGVHILGLSVSLASLPTDQLARLLPSTEGASLKWMVVIPLWMLLIFLGVTLITCVGLQGACMLACNSSIGCGAGNVLRVSSWCGIGCSCECQVGAGSGCDPEQTENPEECVAPNYPLAVGEPLDGEDEVSFD